MFNIDNLDNVKLSQLLFKNSVRLIRQSPTSGVVLYAPPGSGKTYMLNQLITEGLLGIDSDNIYFAWKSKLVKRFKGKKSLTEISRLSESMASWSIETSTTVRGVNVIVTNLHNLFLLYSARAGYTIVGFLPPLDVFKERIKGRKDISESTFMKWYNDVLSWKGTSYDKVNVWVTNLNEFRYLLYSKNFSAIGRSLYIQRKAKGIHEGRTFGDVMRVACMHLAKKRNKIYVSLGAAVREVMKLTEYGKSCRLYGNFQKKMFTVLKQEVLPIKAIKQFSESSELPISILSYCGSAITKVFYVGSPPFINRKLMDITIEKYDFKKVLKCKENFSLVIYRKIYEYGLPENTTSSKEYIDLIKGELGIIDKVRKHKYCARIAYFMIVRNYFSEPLFKVPLKKIFLPYQEYLSTRICMFSQGGHDMDGLVTTYSLSELYLQVLNFNSMRYSDPGLETEAFEHLCSRVILYQNILNYVPYKNDFPVGLFSLSNINNDPQEVEDCIVAMCRRTDCIFTLPNKNMEEFIIHKEDYFEEGLFITEHDNNRVYKDHAYYPSMFYKYKQVQVFESRDIAVFGPSYNHNGKWHKGIMPSCNGKSHLFSVWFAVGRLIKDTRIQTHFNSQTHLMAAFARLLRANFGFDSNSIYRLRGYKALLRDSKITLVNSSEGTYMKDGKVFAVPGHAINMILMSKVYAIDLMRYFDTLEGNYEVVLKNKSILDKIKKLEKMNMIAEDDSLYELWHHPTDYLDVSATVRDLAKIVKFKGLDYSYVNKRVKRLIVRYGKKIKPTSSKKLTIKAK